MGDPAGIGPEVIVGAWASDQLHNHARLLVVGHPEIMRRAAALCKQDVRVVAINPSEPLDSVSSDQRTIPCLTAVGDDVLAVPIGRVDARAGEAAFQAVQIAARLALDGSVDGIVTAPLSKAALHAAGHHYPGHTELLAELCGVTDFAMMLYLSREQGAGSREQEGNGNKLKLQLHAPRSASSGLGVVHVTLHQSLRSVFADLTPTRSSPSAGWSTA